MKSKSKKSVSHDNINLGIIGVTAMSVIVVIVVLISSATADTTMIYAKDLYYEEPILVMPDPTLSQAECEHVGFKRCMDIYPQWNYYQTRTITENYEKCTNKVREICSQAPKQYII